MTEVGNKSFNEYLKIPVSEYSTNILKVNEVKRLDEKNFECILSEVNMLGKTIQPKLFVEVDVGDIVRFNVTSM